MSMSTHCATVRRTHVATATLSAPSHWPKPSRHAGHVLTMKSGCPTSWCCAPKSHMAGLAGNWAYRLAPKRWLPWMGPMAMPLGCCEWAELPPTGMHAHPPVDRTRTQPFTPTISPPVQRVPTAALHTHTQRRNAHPPTPHTSTRTRAQQPRSPSHRNLPSPSAPDPPSQTAQPPNITQEGRRPCQTAMR